MALRSIRPFFTKTILSDLKSLSKEEKYELILKIWPDSGLTSDDFEEADYAAFIGYIKLEASRLGQHQSEFATESIDTTLELIPSLRVNAGDPKHLALSHLYSKAG
jgi:hypothetical protein